MIAALNDSKEIFQLLLDNGADINARNNEGCTALMLAAQENNTGAIRTLLDHGADIDAGDENN